LPDYYFRESARKIGKEYIRGKELFALNFPEANPCILALRCTSGVRLREKLADALSFLRSDANAYQVVNESSKGLNAGLRRCLREGWIHEERMAWCNDQLAKGEFRDKRWPKKILVRHQNIYLAEMALEVLRLSNEVPKAHKHGWHSRQQMKLLPSLRASPSLGEVKSLPNGS
jgi:hypothetical protein